MSIPGRQRLFYLAGAVLAAAFIPLLFLPALNGPHLPLFLLCFSLAGAAYLVGISQLGRSPVPQGVLWGAAVLARLVLLGTVLSLSDDVYRYLWDGHLLVQGISPYAWQVNASALDAFATPLRQLVNHPEMASPYLPAAQAYFWLLERITPQQALTHRMAAMLLDLLTGLVIRTLLVRLRLNPGAVIVYLWNPLLMVEFAGSAHVDALMLFLGMAAWAFVFAEKKWRWVSVAAAGAGCPHQGTAPVFRIPVAAPLGNRRGCPGWHPHCGGPGRLCRRGGMGLWPCSGWPRPAGRHPHLCPLLAVQLRAAVQPGRQPAGLECRGCRPCVQDCRRPADGNRPGGQRNQGLEAGSGWAGQPGGQACPAAPIPASRRGLPAALAHRPSLVCHLCASAAAVFHPGRG